MLQVPRVVEGRELRLHGRANEGNVRGCHTRRRKECFAFPELVMRVLQEVCARGHVKGVARRHGKLMFAIITTSIFGKGSVVITRSICEVNIFSPVVTTNKYL